MIKSITSRLCLDRQAELFFFLHCKQVWADPQHPPTTGNHPVEEEAPGIPERLRGDHRPAVLLCGHLPVVMPSCGARGLLPAEIQQWWKLSSTFQSHGFQMPAGFLLLLPISQLGHALAVNTINGAASAANKPSARGLENLSTAQNIPWAAG